MKKVQLKRRNLNNPVIKEYEDAIKCGGAHPEVMIAAKKRASIYLKKLEGKNKPH